MAQNPNEDLKRKILGTDDESLLKKSKTSEEFDYTEDTARQNHALKSEFREEFKKHIPKIVSYSLTIALLGAISIIILYIRHLQMIWSDASSIDEILRTAYTVISSLVVGTILPTFLKQSKR